MAKVLVLIPVLGLIATIARFAMWSIKRWVIGERAMQQREEEKREREAEKRAQKAEAQARAGVDGAG
jgi:phosphate/sulfate permease